MTVLVTGGAGFIGSNFIRYLLRNYPDYNIVNLDKLTYAGNLINLRGISLDPRYHFVKGDIADEKLVKSILEEYKVEWVVNFAAESHVDRSIVDPGLFIETNVSGTRALLDAAYQHDIKKFLQISTDEVYGSLGETGYFTEETPLAPNSPYSASKAAADLLVLAYYKTYNMSVAITRCSNNYGPYQLPEKLIPLMITNALEDKDLPVYGDGLNVRDWLHVEDHCRAVDLVLHKASPGSIYNIGGHHEKSNIDMIKTILSLLRKPESLICYVEDRKGHDRRYAIKPDKIMNELGWRPVYSLERGLEETIRWYLDNPKWYEAVQDNLSADVNN
ncbi:dTDP-glucose 4,6-dehydratase [Lentibacillus persicus]|uniref:dTDP-glucose 4,6-dehydratase n=1 Tax=Lentibacillus persicus TaxID=640948 RepID=A0A1I1U826_9BACI|nr:dTDP-glucose 4,6-dehydratase [Lentibacillus persicus]SFD66805.1 dTDP-glucose 4,6-dehydratase [Lentibacillus persicus]